MKNPRKPAITLRALMFLLIVFSDCRPEAFSQNQQLESRIRVTVPGVPGGGPSNTIEAYGYSGGILQSPSGTLTFEDFSITKAIDKATPILSQKVAQGSRFMNDVKVEVYRFDPNTQVETLYLTISMTKARITSSKLAADNLKSLSSAAEQISLCYSGITYRYKFPVTGDKVFVYDRLITSC
jgi:type VI protein secretion system component Hcp